MRNSPIILLLVAVLAGCAGTQQAAVEPIVAPVTTTVAASEPVVAEASPAPAVAAVTEVPPPPAVTTKTQGSMQGQDPYQWMLSWAQGMQQALKPWAQSVQACDTRTDKR